jgi:signal transduction histidine kinase/CheY-like chemotaxis protein
MPLIYLVDGRPINRHFLATLLSCSGHTLTEARDGTEALAFVQQRLPDLIILDIAVLQMDLDKFMDHLRCDPEKRNIPVILYCATAPNRGAYVIARSFGAEFTLPGPGEPKSILPAVAQALGLHRAGGMLYNRRTGERRVNSESLKSCSPSPCISNQMPHLHLEQESFEHKTEALTQVECGHKEVQPFESQEEQQALIESLQESVRTKEQMLILLTRQAAMGGMISYVAHQWRQPLNDLGLLIQQLPLLHKSGPITEKDLRNCTDCCMKLILYMSETIEEFLDFSSPNKKKTLFRANQAIAKAVSLISKNLCYLRINLETIEEGDPLVYGYPNEFIQVLLVILRNAKDSLVEHRPQNPRIFITSSVDNPFTVVKISDNGGGIESQLIDKVFDLYFTTKGESSGTGIGLFMAKMIIEESMQGKLTVHNTVDGVEFVITVRAEMPEQSS